MAYLGLAGGRDVAITTRKVLSKLMTNAVAHKLNYHGHGAKHACHCAAAERCRYRSVFSQQY